ncbi:MAG: response regulator [Proteobacteria bacterium]|nr:response regulator [Pseudomonadota bacterium]
MSTNIHIIDSSKASLVMTSEIFKDKIPGSLVSFSGNAKDALTYIATKQGAEAPDLIVVDFDLPDADGVSLVRELRKSYKGPVFLTAFPSDVVKHAVSEELFHYNDSCQWISKPVKSDQLDKKIEQFLINRYRLGRRFDVEFMSLLVGKGAGRGKRAPKFDGKTTNLSLGGAGFDLAQPAKLKIGDEMILSLAVPQGQIDGAGPIDNLKETLAASRAAESKSAKIAKITESKKSAALPKKGATTSKLKGSKTPEIQVEKQEAIANQKSTPLKFQEYKIRATVAWLGGGGKKAGLTFGKITDQQRRQIETFLKGLAA